MRHLILNIGLGHEHPIDTAAWALDLLPALGRIENAMLLLDAKDEPVFVVYVESDLTDPVPALTRVAVHLQQEAIAVWDATEARGYMAGPKREAWEPFDPEKFLTWSAMPPLSTPPHKQTDPAKRPGQIVNPLPSNTPGTPPKKD